MKKKKPIEPISALDVAAYILANHTNNNPIDAWTMHKLVYYCQAWCLVLEGEPFFQEKILASAKGILISELCPQHHSQLYIGGSTIGNLNHLSLRQVDVIAYVMKKYGSKSIEEMDALIRSEDPWKNARQSLSPNDKGSIEISLASMSDYYSKQKK